MNKVKSLNEVKVIRNLGDDESLYDNEILNGNFILSLALLVEIKEPYVSLVDWDVLRRAAQIWTNKYLLLKATIWRSFDINDPNQRKIGSPKYFVEMEKFEDFANIRIENTTNENEWKSVLESELKTQFDNINGPLWRINLIHLIGSNRFTFVFTVHHSLGDGKNLFFILTEYIDLVADQLLGNYQHDKYFQIEQISSENTMEELVELHKSQPDYTFIHESTGYNSNANKISSKLCNFETGSYARFDCFLIEKSILDKLIDKMKKETKGAKLTAVLKIIVAVCMRKLYEKYQVNDVDEIDSIQCKILVDLRKKLNLSDSQMGIYSVSLNCRMSIGNHIQFINDEKLFWRFVEEQSLFFHRRLKNNEDIEQIGEENDELIEMINNNVFTDNFSEYDFVLSNFGVVSSNKCPVIALKEHYVAMPSKQPSFAGSFFNAITTINGNLCWSISFNDLNYSFDFIADVKQEIQDFIRQLVRD